MGKRNIDNMVFGPGDNDYGRDKINSVYMETHEKLKKLNDVTICINCAHYRNIFGEKLCVLNAKSVLNYVTGVDIYKKVDCVMCGSKNTDGKCKDYVSNRIIG